jgi:hypothetical protein
MRSTSFGRLVIGDRKAELSEPLITQKNHKTQYKRGNTMFKKQPNPSLLN